MDGGEGLLSWILPSKVRKNQWSIADMRCCSAHVLDQRVKIPHCMSNMLPYMKSVNIQLILAVKTKNYLRCRYHAMANLCYKIFVY